jgi:hypothetical protein
LRFLRLFAAILRLGRIVCWLAYLGCPGLALIVIAHTVKLCLCLFPIRARWMCRL